jgi:hypothetical protein
MKRDIEHAKRRVALGQMLLANDEIREHAALELRFEELQSRLEAAEEEGHYDMGAALELLRQAWFEARAALQRSSDERRGAADGS